MGKDRLTLAIPVEFSLTRDEKTAQDENAVCCENFILLKLQYHSREAAPNLTRVVVVAGGYPTNLTSIDGRRSRGVPGRVVRKVAQLAVCHRLDRVHRHPAGFPDVRIFPVPI